MPALFFLGQRAALQAIQQQLQPDELLLAYLDDMYAVVPPEFEKFMTSWPTRGAEERCCWSNVTAG